MILISACRGIPAFFAALPRLFHGHGQHGNLGLWRAGAQRLQRALRVHLLSTPALQVTFVSEVFYSGCSRGQAEVLSNCVRTGASCDVAQIRSVNIQLKSLSHYASRQNRCIVSAVFEVKKKFRFDNCGNRELDEARSRYVERFNEKG